MKTYILPYEEYIEGWYEIEANSLDEAKAIAKEGQFTEYTEGNSNKGWTDWNEEDMFEKKEDNGKTKNDLSALGKLQD